METNLLHPTSLSTIADLTSPSSETTTSLPSPQPIPEIPSHPLTPNKSFPFLPLLGIIAVISIMSAIAISAGQPTHNTAQATNNYQNPFELIETRSQSEDISAAVNPFETLR